MAINPYAQQIVEFLQSNSGKFTVKDVSAQFNLTSDQVRGIARRNSALGLFRPDTRQGGIISQESSFQPKRPQMELDDDKVREVILAEQKAKQATDKGSFAERKYKMLLAENERILAENEALTSIKLGDVRKFNIKPQRATQKGEGVPAIVWSDWHCEEKIDPRTIGGKNKYTLDIAAKRAEKVAQSTLKMIQQDALHTDISEAALFLLGDFITGNIHEENVENAQLLPVEAVLYAQGLIESNLDLLLRETNLNFTVYCKAGNHSRITPKVRASTELGNSLELALYVSMAKRYENNPRVKFHIEPSYYSIVNILGTRVRFHHGHAVAYGGGVGGLHIPLRKAIKSWNETARADLDIMGHYHSFLEHTTAKYMVNGSLIGYSAYAERVKAVIEPPLQGYCLIHKKYGVTRPTPIFAE